MNAAVEIPARMILLDRDEFGLPIPWFLVDGTRDRRTINPRKLEHAVRARCCWICGQRLGRYVCWVGGPVEAVRRISGQPPSHINCATYAATAFPEMARPTSDDPEPKPVMVWTTINSEVVRMERAILFDLGKPTSIEWMCDGRPATRAEVLAAINSEIRGLVDAAVVEGQIATVDLVTALEAIEAKLPREPAVTEG